MKEKSIPILNKSFPIQMSTKHLTVQHYRKASATMQLLSEDTTDAVQITLLVLIVQLIEYNSIKILRYHHKMPFFYLLHSTTTITTNSPFRENSWT